MNRFMVSYYFWTTLLTVPWVLPAFTHIFCSYKSQYIFAVIVPTSYYPCQTVLVQSYDQLFDLVDSYMFWFFNYDPLSLFAIYDFLLRLGSFFDIMPRTNVTLEFMLRVYDSGLDNAIIEWKHSNLWGCGLHDRLSQSFALIDRLRHLNAYIDTLCLCYQQQS